MQYLLARENSPMDMHRRDAVLKMARKLQAKGITFAVAFHEVINQYVHPGL